MRGERADTDLLVQKTDRETLRRVWQSHARRLAQLDPLLPPPIDPTAPDGPFADDVILQTEQFGSRGVGIWQQIEVDPGSFDAAFGPLRRHRLRVLLDGPDRAVATESLLDSWAQALAERVGDQVTDPDAGAIITWPARDVDGIASLVQRGFFCDHALAGLPVADLAHREPAQPIDGVVLRPARLHDADTVCALQMEGLIYDDRLGGMRLRPSTERVVRAQQVATLSRNDGSRIIAERDGHPVGLIAISLATEDSWLNDWIHSGPIAYIECLSVTERERTRGVGRLLADAAHQWAQAADASVLMLHHAVVNPYSSRFWGAQGYRPLWIRWSAPLSRLLG